jgi:hypothetical protein
MNVKSALFITWQSSGPKKNKIETMNGKTKKHFPGGESSCRVLRFWTVTVYSILGGCSAVGIATACGLKGGGVGVRVPVESRIFSSPSRPDRLWGPPNLLSNGYRGLFSRGVKRLRRKTDHFPPASVKVKKMWIYTPLSHTPSWYSAKFVSTGKTLPFLPY